MVLPLPELIDNACTPARREPKVTLNLEICERINKQGGTLPRTAAMTIARYVNSSIPQQGLLALTLLDSCVKNCGYPFHIQIASKEFLNTLVRKLPEHPPVRYTVPSQQSAPENTWNRYGYASRSTFSSLVTDRILYLIKAWNSSLAETSRYKKDMIHINDMYRLLRYKGYKFPEILDSSIAALSPEESLKSAEELEEEDHIAQKAKLQELIRRGKPPDLAEANKLVKILSGYDQRQKSSYGERFMEELRKVKNKAMLLCEMLDNAQEDESAEDNRIIMELKGACKSALPKIDRMLKAEEEESRIDDLLEVSELIHNVLDRVNKFQGLSTDTTSQSFQQTKVVDQPISLIDLDDEPQLVSRKSDNTINELSQLFGMPSPPAPQPDTIDLLPLPDQENQSAHRPIQILPPKTSSPSTILSNAKACPPATITAVTLVDRNGLLIDMEITKKESEWNFTAYFSNKSTASMEKMILHLAAPKTMSLHMDAQPNQIIPAKSHRAVKRTIWLTNPEKKPLRLRYKVTYEQFGVEMEQSGDYHE